MAKTLNALIYPSAPTVIAERRMIDTAADIPAGPQHNYKASLWRPVVEVGNDAFDPATQKKTGPVTTIEATQVVDTYTISSLSAPELDAAKTAAVENINGLFKPLLKILLDHENRIRAQKSPPDPALNMTDFKTYIKTKL